MADGFQATKTARALGRVFAFDLSPQPMALVHKWLDPMGPSVDTQNIPNIIDTFYAALAFGRPRVFDRLGQLRDLSPEAAECAVVSGLASLGRMRERWVRPMGSFRPTRTSMPFIVQLARHLLVKYEMPAFMDSVWCVTARPHASVVDSCRQSWIDGDWRDIRKCRDWYADIGAGLPADGPNSPYELRADYGEYFIRNYRVAPPRAHLVMQAPESFRLPWDATRIVAWSEIRRAGAPEEFALRLAYTRIAPMIIGMGTDLIPRRPTYAALVRFLVRHPEFPFEQIDPVCDFFYRNQDVFWFNPTLRGVTPHNLLLDVETWHRYFAEAAPRSITAEMHARARLTWQRHLAGGRARANARYAGQLADMRRAGVDIPNDTVFAPSGRRGLILGDPQLDFFRNISCWTLTELLTAKELREEGAAMGHCVATYAEYCRSGHSSIWSLCRAGPGGPLKRRLTLQLTVDGRMVQARGERNRMPTRVEWAVLKAWAKPANITLEQIPPPIPDPA